MTLVHKIISSQNIQFKGFIVDQKDIVDFKGQIIATLETNNTDIKKEVGSCEDTKEIRCFKLEIKSLLKSYMNN